MTVGGVARNGTVHQAPLVMAVHARGSPSASWAGGRPHIGPPSRPDLGVPRNHSFDRPPQPPEEEGQRGEPHPPCPGHAHLLLIVTHPQISDRATYQECYETGLTAGRAVSVGERS
jgi:hypothetical protein